MKTTWKLTLPLILVSSMGLTACGGGSSSSDNNTGGTGGGGGTNTVTLTASVVQSTVCNTEVPASSAELVVYDDNWAIKSRHKADANGNISATIAQTNNVNISFIGTSGTGANRQLEVVTHAQHPIGDLGVYAIPGTATQGCECVVTDITMTSDLGNLDYNVQLAGANSHSLMSRINPNTVAFDNVSICRETGSSWPTLYGASNSNYDGAFAGSLTGYNPNQPLMIVLDQSPTTRSAIVQQDSLYANITHQLPNGQLTTSMQSPYNEMPFFEQLADVEVVSLRGGEVRTEYVDGLTVRLGRSQRHSVALPFSETLEITLPSSDIQQQLFSMLQQLLESDGTDYDLTAVSDLDTFYLNVLFNLTDGSRYSQYFYGPKKASIPDEALPADYGVDALIDDSNLDLSVSMLGYDNQQSYQQYQASRVRASKQPLNQRLIDDRSKFSQVYIQLSQ